MNPDIEKTRLSEGMIDSHFHLYHMKKRNMDHMGIITHAFSSGLEAAVDIGINSENFEDRIQTATTIPGLYTAHGYYPSECSSDILEQKLGYLTECLEKDQKAVALGEIGFDFYHDYGNEKLQESLFRKQIEIADSLNLPIIVHSRDAEKQTLNLLRQKTPRAGGIIHCFSYSAETAQQFIDLGFYISFAGNVTYKKAQLLQEAAASVPLNRLLLETDAPYLSPQKVRNKKNHPGYIGYTYEFVAALKQITTEELTSTVNNNFKTLFKINHQAE